MIEGFGLKKLRIDAFRKASRTGAIKSLALTSAITMNQPASTKGTGTEYYKTFEVMYNPESVSVSYSNEWQEEQGLGKSDSPIRYINTSPEKISFKLIFSNTGTERLGLLKIRPRKSVQDWVKEFTTICVKADDELHRPFFLKLSWGDTLDYACQVTSVDIAYTLFDRKGNPMRAELDVEFTEDQIPSPEGLGQSSPDVTHARFINSGDTLPIMAEKIYKDPSFYMMVASANELDSVRNIVTGESIVFPPIKK